MNINVESVILPDIPPIPNPSEEPAIPPPAPSSYTIADLQQSFAPNSTRVIGGTTPAADAEVLRDILLAIKNDERRRLYFRLLLLLLLAPITIFATICMMPVFYMQYARHISGTKEVAKDVRYMIRLEGDQWSRYVEHIFADSPRRMKKASTKRVLARGYGHVVLGPQGLFLDALLDMTYENMMMVVRTEVIRASNGEDMMLRAWFRKRIIATNMNTNISNDRFKFDIFLPPNMTTERLASITNFIMKESTCCADF